MIFDDIPKLCITLPETPEKRAAAESHFAESGIGPVTFVAGINGQRFGIKTVFPYAVDDKTGNFFTGHHEAGIFLSHYMVWTAALLLNHPYVAVFEDDVKLLPGWKDRVNRALNDCPEFDWMFCGSCGVGDNKGTLIAGEVFDCRYPCCLHFYIVSRKGAEILVQTQRKIWGPVDVTIYHPDPLGGSQTAFDKMKVVTVLPRLAEQFNTVIDP